jgi:hypothetical protein
MKVLKDENVRLFGAHEGVENAGEEAVGRDGARQHLGAAVIECVRHILKRPESSRRREWIAPAPMNRMFVIDRAKKMLEQRRLADARLALDNDDLSSPGIGALQCPRQGLQRGISL